MPTIGTTSEIRHTLGSHKVYTSDKLRPASWTYQEYLWCKALKCLAAPDIDEADLEWQYGLFSGEFREMKDLDRKYIKIEVFKEDGTIVWTWFGVIEVDTRDPGGTRTATAAQAALTPGLNPGDAIPHGEQHFMAYGLLRELERTIVGTSQVLDQAGNQMEIGHGLSFNHNRYGHYVERGNRSDPVFGVGGDVAIFSHEPHGEDLWRVSDVVEYLLEWYEPPDVNGDPVCEWVFGGPTAAVEWLEASARTDGRNVKEILDDLLDRRRLLGYWVQGVATGPNVGASLSCFTFSENPIPIPGTMLVIPENPNPVTLDFETAFDIDVCVLSNNSAHIADRVIAQGDFITSTFTISWSDISVGLFNGWESGEETDFLAGASGEAGYSGWTLDKKQKANQQARGTESLSHVFSRFVPAEDWGGTTFDVFSALASTEISCIPDADPDELDGISDLDTSSVYTIATAPGHQQTWSWKRKPFLSYLPFKNPASTNNVDDFIRPFVCWRIEEGTGIIPDTWAAGHKLTTVGDDEQEFGFSTRLYMLEGQAGIRVEVSNGVQQLVARDSWAGAAETKKNQDPTKRASVSFKNWSGGWMIATVAVECDHRVQAVYERTGPAPEMGKHLREVIIDVPSARLDLMAPYTVTDLDAQGYLVQSANGQILRDDRDWLKQIAEAAGAWYSVKRQALKLKWKQLDPLGLEIGHLVTDIGARYNDPDVKSVITGIIFDFDAGTTEVETAYADLDVASVFRIV
jgi:hypothetical protein